VRLVILVGVQAVLTALFWFAAARIATSHAVGIAAALYTSLQFVNYLTGMGLTVMLARFGAGAGRDQDSWFSWSTICTVASSAVGAVIYLMVVSSPATDLLRGGAVGYLAFFGLTAGASLGLLVDVRLIGGRRWGWLAVKNLLIGCVRIPLVFVHPIGSESLWLFAVVAVPQAVVGMAGAVALPSIMDGRIRFHRPAAWRQAVRFTSVNWVANLATQAPVFAVPLIVALHVRASTNAPFFLAWSLSATVSLAPAAISQVVLVEGSRNDHDFRGPRQALTFAIILSLVALVGSLLFVPFITMVYGSGYRLTAEILPLLVAASVPWSVAAILLSVARLRHDHLSTVVITLTLGIGNVGLALLLVPSWGPGGAVLAWVVGNVCAAAVAVVLARLRWRSAAPSPTPETSAQPLRNG
jgi:O-antigen/teichoic acid export membrane protein